MTRRPSELKIGVATAADPRDPAAFSGWPASLLGALAGVAGEVVALDGSLPPRLERAAALAGTLAALRPADLRAPRSALSRALPSAWLLGRPAIWARSASVAAQLRRRCVDGCIMLGTEVTLPAGVPFVTFQDSTLIQARQSYPWPYLGAIGDEVLERYVRRQRAIYRSAVACGAATQWAADSIVADYGIAREKVHVVGIGRNHEIPPPPARDWSTPRFLFVGYDWQRKNGPRLLGAFAEVRRRHPAAELHLVGNHPQVAGPGVVAHGATALGDPAGARKLADLFARATCFVMVSLHEPSGTVYAEAAATGLASIGTTNGGSATVIGPGGLLVDPHDERALVAAMLGLCDPETARRLGALAGAHAREMTWARVAQRLVAALHL